MKHFHFWFFWQIIKWNQSLVIPWPSMTTHCSQILHWWWRVKMKVNVHFLYYHPSEVSKVSMLSFSYTMQPSHFKLLHLLSNFFFVCCSMNILVIKNSSSKFYNLMKQTAMDILWYSSHLFQVKMWVLGQGIQNLMKPKVPKGMNHGHNSSFLITMLTSFLVFPPQQYEGMSCMEP